MTYEEQKKQGTIRRFRLAKWLVLFNTLYWIVYIIGAQLGYEQRFPLGAEIIRLENREKAEFLEPAVSDAMRASISLVDPRKKTRFPIGEQPRTFAFSINLDGPWALGLWPGQTMKINPKVALLDAEGRLLADNSRSPYYWKPYTGARNYRSEEEEERRKLNSHGSGLTHELKAGQTYLLRISPESNQDFTYTVYTQNERSRRPHAYDLIIQPYRSNEAYPVIALTFLIGVPVVYLFLLLRLSFRLAKQEGRTPARLGSDQRFSDFKKRVAEKRKENRP